MFPITIRALFTLILLALFQAAQADPIDVTIRLASGNEIVSQRYPAEGKVLAVWITGQYGNIQEEQKAAADLAAHGVETWVTDLLSPYFLPLLASSVKQVPDDDLGAWLEELHQRNPGRRILLIASGHAASLVLRGVHAWRALNARAAADAAGGALLLFPLLYQELLPGEEPTYEAEAAQTPMRLVILQPQSSAGYWWRERLQAFLESAGSRVMMKVLPGLRDGFYERGDINAREVAAASNLGQILLNGLQPLLESDAP